MNKKLWLLVLVLPIAALVLYRMFTMVMFHVVGNTMSPHLTEGQIVLAKRAGDIQRGDILVFSFPQDPQLTMIKRVIALPGERITIKDGVVEVFNSDHPQGFDPDSEYGVDGQGTLGTIDQTVPGDHYFVIGDNRNPGGSYDSREWGPLENSDIIGKVVEICENGIIPIIKVCR